MFRPIGQRDRTQCRAALVTDTLCLIRSESHRPMTEFPNADYLRARAVHWRNLAEEVDDPELAAQYEECAATYEVRADSAEVEGSVH